MLLIENLNKVEWDLPIHCRRNDIYSAPRRISYITDDITYLLQLQAAQKRTKHAFQPGTTANQHSQIKRHLTFCFTYNVTHLSPSVNTVLAYMEHLAQSLSSHISVMNYLSAIKHLHRLSGARFTAFSAYPVSLLIRALPLTMTSRSAPKHPITLSLL